MDSWEIRVYAREAGVTEKKLLEHTREIDGCLLWTGPVTDSGTPRVDLPKGKKGFGSVTVRRVVAALNGFNFEEYQNVGVACREQTCINVEHMFLPNPIYPEPQSYVYVKRARKYRNRGGLGRGLGRGSDRRIREDSLLSYNLAA